MIPRKYHIGLVPLLLASFFAQAWFSWREKSPTFDEPTHLAAGWSYLKTGDYRLNPEHPPLIKQWAALPMLALVLAEPEDYRGWEMRHQGTFAHFLFFEGNPVHRMFDSAHFMMILLATLMGVWIYFWSRELWGHDGALLSLGLFAFSPNLIAHSAVVGTDYGMASFGLLSLWLWARMLARPTWPRTLLAGVGVALALLTKFSAAVLIPVWFGWWLLALLSGGKWPSELMPVSSGNENADPDRYASKFRPPWHGEALAFWAGRLSAILFAAGLLIFADYGFQWTPIRAGLDHFSDHLGRGHPAFLRGEVGIHGWLSYFPIAYAIKTPLPEMLLMVASILLWIRSRRGWGPWALLIAPWLVVLGSAMISGVSIGYRHVLLMIPLGLVVAGGVLAARRDDEGKTSTPSEGQGLGGKGAKSLVALACVWQLWAAASIYPDHLTYFNEAIGGPRNGHLWLSDSNVDWGQDLTTLAEWMDSSEVPWVYLAYFGTAEVSRYGVGYRRLPGYNVLRDSVVRFDAEHPAPGVYAISATHLGGQYLQDPDTYRWFREREPDERVGNSVFIYAVGPESSPESSP